jgi:ligand-binding SRPBCC domain-containing protein
MPRIELSTHIVAPPERCFDLSRSVELHMQSTAATGEVAVGGRTRGLLELGEEVTWRARHFGVWQTLTSRIVAYDRPRHFRDSMVQGPFTRLDHDHHFAKHGRGGTVMRDVFDFAAPLGLLGRVAERLVLTRYLCRFLEARNREIKVIAESDAWRRFVP